MTVAEQLQALELDELVRLMEAVPDICKWERFRYNIIDQVDRWHHIAPLGLSDADVNALRAPDTSAAQWIVGATRAAAMCCWLAKYLLPQQCTELTRRLPSSRPARRRRMAQAERDRVQ